MVALWREMYVNESETLKTGTLCYTLGVQHRGEPELFERHTQRLRDEQDACDYLYVVRTNPDLSDDVKADLLRRRQDLLKKWGRS